MAMERAVSEIVMLANEHRCPVIVAGDIFDKWNSSAELINWTIDQLGYLQGNCFTVAGNHDLAYHSLDEDQMKKTAYHTLVRTGSVRHLQCGFLINDNGMTLCGFSHGLSDEVQPHISNHVLETSIQVAVIHDYIWTKSTGHVGADPSKRYTEWLKRTEGYHAIVMGDNHRSIFKGRICNSGTLMRRKADEIGYKPAVGLLHSDGTITQHFLDYSEDKFIDGLDVLQDAEKVSDLDLSGFIAELTGLADNDLNFGEAVIRYMETADAGDEVRKILMNAIGRGA